jgi:hypothetical protein
MVVLLAAAVVHLQDCGFEPLRRQQCTTLQLNIGLYCNQVRALAAPCVTVLFCLFSSKTSFHQHPWCIVYGDEQCASLI